MSDETNDYLRQAANNAMERVFMTEGLISLLDSIQRMAFQDAYRLGNDDAIKAFHTIRNHLYQKEMDAYRQVMMWALAGENTESVRQLVASRFLNEHEGLKEMMGNGSVNTQIMHHLQRGIDPRSPGKYYSSEREAFQDQICRAFRVELEDILKENDNE